MGINSPVASVLFSYFSPDFLLFLFCFLSLFSFLSMAAKQQLAYAQKNMPRWPWTTTFVCECVTFSHTGSSVHLMHEFRAILRWSTVSEPLFVVSRIAAAHLAAMFTMNRTPIEKKVHRK